jgi:hypothetical protein
VTEIYVEVRPGPRAAGDLTSVADLRQKLTDRIDDVGNGLKEIATSLSRRLDDLAAAAAHSTWHLGEVEITFSLDLEAEAGVVVARTKAGAGFEAKLTWKAGPLIQQKE